ncbi:MAG: hypothetical protein Q8L60_16040 [Gammaproteobacteria bacterium]|nr:hypothetical protein [Gammaproteobacteria bacterium]MDP2347455.1 hypothetical protein [Gammaproteobacteria bacterium]
MNLINEIIRPCPGLRLSLLLVCFFYSTNVSADYNFITTAEVLVIDTATPPVDAAGWRTVVLPRSWSRDDLHPKDTRQAWYRIAMPQDAAERRWNHLLILRHMMNMEIWLNGQFIGSGGPVSDPVQLHLQRNWNRPILWTFPDAALAFDESPEYLYIRLISEPNFGVMSPVIIGTAEALRPWYSISYFVQITLVKISLMALLFIGSLSLFVWNKTRQPQWGLMAAMSACWSLPVLYIMVPVLPMAEFSALRLTHWGVVSGACALLAFIYSYYLKADERYLRLLLPIPIVHGVLLVMAPDNQVVNIGNAGQILFQILFVVLIVQLLRSPLRKSRAVLGVVAGLVIMLLAALHDVTLVSSTTGERWRWDTPLSYVTQPIMLVILAWNGVSVFVAGSLRLAAANRQLQERLDASELRIRQVFAEQENMEREIRIEAERELVYRDLHDDLGARLLSLVYQSEKGAAQDLARTALQDLRDIVSRVLADEQSMSAVLADCMAEQLSRASVLNRELDWHIDDALDAAPCPSKLMLGLRLLLRELIGGCLRLEGVQALRIHLSATNSPLVLGIRMTLHDSSGEPAILPVPRLPVLLKRLHAIGATMTQEDTTILVQM